MSGYLLHPDVYKDLDQIWNFITEDNPDAADRLLDDIHDSIRGLVRFPDQGHWRTDLASKYLRFQTLGNYLIAYAPSERPLLVLAVLQGNRNTRTMASVLRGRKSER